MARRTCSVYLNFARCDIQIICLNSPPFCSGVLVIISIGHSVVGYPIACLRLFTPTVFLHFASVPLKMFSFNLISELLNFIFHYVRNHALLHLYYRFLSLSAKNWLYISSLTERCLLYSSFDSIFSASLSYAGSYHEVLKYIIAAICTKSIFHSWTNRETRTQALYLHNLFSDI